MCSKRLLTGIVVGIVMGVLFSAAVVLAGSLEPGGGSTAAGSQGNSSSYLPIVLKAGGSSSVGVPRTGQTTSYGPRDDGALQKGVAWPSPRLTDNGNGTVTDNLTGLIWLKNANFFGVRNWATALTDCNTLAANGTTLTDGSVAGDWRLPNKRELFSLIDDSNNNPALPTGHPFTGVQSFPGNYWSSTTYADGTDWAWYVYLNYGYVNYGSKAYTFYVWPVRGGQ
jgi:hypothetical protein